MKALKIIVGILVAAFVIFTIIIVVTFSNVDSIIKKAIETVGSELTQTAVRVKNVDISLQNGSGIIEGLSVANPQGFSKDSLLVIGRLAVDLDVSSATKPVKVIEELYLTGLSLKGELQGLRDTNIEALYNNIQTSLPSSQKTPKPPVTVTEDGEKDVRLRIEKLRFGEIALNLSSDKWGSRKVMIPAYEENNIGQKNIGLTPPEIGKAVLDSILKRAEKSAKKEIDRLVKSEIEDKVNERLGQEKAKLNERLEKEKTKLEDQLSEKDKENIDKLKSLFK